MPTEHLILNVRGRRDLTEQCLFTMGPTLGQKGNITLTLVDASLPYEGVIDLPSIRNCLGDYVNNFDWIVYTSAPGANMSCGWNRGTDVVLGRLPPDTDKSQQYFYYVNNDVIFKKSGWLQKISERLSNPSTGSVGSSAQCVLGHGFSTGAVIGLKLSAMLDAFDGNREFMHPMLNYAYGDVAIGVRLARKGYETTWMPEIEAGDDSYLLHLISQTVYSREGLSRVMQYRKEEAKLFIDLYGRKDGMSGYEGI